MQLLEADALRLVPLAGLQLELLLVLLRRAVAPGERGIPLVRGEAVHVIPGGPDEFAALGQGKSEECLPVHILLQESDVLQLIVEIAAIDIGHDSLRIAHRYHPPNAWIQSAIPRIPPP
jgi:hypothetical protein